MSTTAPFVQIQDWQSNEFDMILNFLVTSIGDDDDKFNPEGSLEMDCSTSELLQESYDTKDGGCFLVAKTIILDTDNNDKNEDGDDASKPFSANKEQIVGTAGLIVGTPVEYYTSGSSRSSPQTVVAAVRRCYCCCRRHSQNVQSLSNPSTTTDTTILERLFQVLEQRAAQAGATEIVALAYPTPSFRDSDHVTIEKPTSAFLETLGYERLLQQIPGIDAIQYGKNLKSVLRDNSTQATVLKTNKNLTTTGNDASETNQTQRMLALSGLLFTGILGLLLAGWIGVAQFMGFDTMLPVLSAETQPDAAINRGLGRPLTSQDLGQLLQDEQLKRTTLSLDDREWNDLTLEEKREELALLQVIQGQNIRIK